MQKPVMREPNSVRYWRLNSIDALRMQYAGVLEPPADPEESERRKAAFTELRQLVAHEAAVMERAKRIFSFRSR